MSFKAISDEQHALFVSALRAGQYNLLLGAGASMDSTNRFGNYPSGEGFKLELCKLKSVSNNYSLQRVYSLLSPEEVEKHVTQRLSGSTPGDTVKLISSFVWRRIFSWNLDDTVEEAYKSSSARQSLKPIHYTDDYAEFESLSELQLIYLHGSVLRPDSGYVFSRNEYISNIKNISHWMVVLTQLMNTEPIIIAGTSLDEVDLDYYLSHRLGSNVRSDRGPSILVEKADDAVTRDLCKKHNLLHFVGYSVDFLKYCTSVLPRRPTPYELLPLEMRKLIPEGVSRVAAMAFESDFELVPASAEAIKGSPRFLFGHPPKWQDLEANLDVSRVASPRLLASIEKASQSTPTQPSIYLISQPPGTGKTTVLRRVAFELAKRGMRVLFCSSLGRISRTTADIIDLIDEPLILVVDNLADQASSISDLLATVERKDLTVIAGERSYREKYILSWLSKNAVNQTDDLSLAQLEVGQLIDNYAGFGLLGNSDAVQNRSAFIEAIAKDPIAVACCRILNDFSPLDAIVAGLVKTVSKQDLDRYLIAAIARFTFTGGVRAAILNSIVRSGPFAAQLQPDHPLPLTYSDRGESFLVPENSTIGDRVLAFVSETDRQRLLDCFVSFANGIAPRVNRQMIIKRTPEARAAGRLFNYDDVVRRYLDERSDEFYQQTQPAWQWNSRYWEQVALLKLSHHYQSPATQAGKDALAAAIRHARHAASIEDHPFPLTTLAKVLMAQMSIEKSHKGPFFHEALEKLHRAMEIELQRDRSAPQPFSTLFRGTIAYLDSGGKLSTQQLDILRTHSATAKTQFRSDPEMMQLAQQVEARLS